MGPWRNNGMSMRNPMSRAPMNNNPMGNQAPMQPNFGRAVGAIGATSLPYAGGSLGMAGPATAVQGMSAIRPAPVRQRPQGTSYGRAMSGDQIFGQNGIGVQRAAQNVLMGQPMGADTRMRGLNIPGMQFDANQNAMVRQQRPQLMFNPSNAGNLSGGTLTRTDDQRWSRMARQAGVRPQDMQAWRTRKIAEGGGLPNPQSPAGGEFVGPVIPNGQRVQMGAQMGAQQPATTPVAAAVRPAPAEQRQTMFAQAVANNRARDVGYAEEAMAIAGNPSMSAGEHLARSSMLAVNRTASMIGDAYKNLAYGNPQQAVGAGLEERTKAERDYAAMRTGQRQDQRSQWAREDAVLPVKSWMDSRLAQLRGRNQGNADFRAMRNYATTPQAWRNVIYGEERSYPGY